MVYMDNLQKATELRTLHQTLIPIVHRLVDLKEMDLHDDAMRVLEKIHGRAVKYEKDVLITGRPVRQRARKRKPMKVMAGVMPKTRAKTFGEGLIGRATKLVK
jgi:hypothetical protein